jgi:prepilin-type N-terminal cleavage/methylation domain-containing protein
LIVIRFLDILDVMKRGFTLIELLVVIGIIGLLATFAVVQMSGARTKASLAKGAAFSGQILRSLGDEVVGRWDFEDCSGTTVADMSGLGGTGTITAATWSTDAPGGACALSFNGTSAYVVIPDSSNFDVTSFTISAWVRTAGATSRRRIVSQQVTTYWGMGLLDNRLEYIGSNDGLLNRGPLLNDSKWHHVAITREAGQWIVWYVDGAEVAREAITSTASYAIDSGMYIGRHPASASQFFVGDIDEVRIYRRALTASAIQNLYAESADVHSERVASR